MDLTKGYRLRVKTGCGTCRIRKVKCDESKPECLRCVNTGRKCDGYCRPTSSKSRSVSPLPPISHENERPKTTSPKLPDVANTTRASVNATDLITLQPNVTHFDSANQREAFNFFVSCTTPMSSLYYGNGFWCQYVLKLSFSVPAIRYALCSLSELHRTFQIEHDPNDPADSTEHRKNSIAQYGLAIKHTQTILAEVSMGKKERLVEGLILCVLFVCYENLIGHYKFAQMHLQNGLKILSKESQPSADASPSKNNGVIIPREVIGVFHRLDLQAMSFADAAAPYPYGLYSDSIKTGPKLPNSDYINDFTESLTDCFRWIFLVANTTAPDPIPSRELEMAAIFLRLWDLQFRRFIGSCEEEVKAGIWENIRVLELYHSLMVILVSVGVYGDEMLHDQHVATYRKIVQTGAEIVQHGQEVKNPYIFTFEMGIILPLFYTALKCRDPGVRRNAVALLLSAHHQEGSWESVAAGQIADFVVRIEERSLIPKLGLSSIPAVARVHLIDAHVNIEKKHIEFGCLMKDTSDNWHRQSEPVILMDEQYRTCQSSTPGTSLSQFQFSTERPTCGSGRLGPEVLENQWGQRKVIPPTAKITGVDSWTVIGSMVFSEEEPGFHIAPYWV